MSWNYRVILTTEDDGTVVYGIHEVYYDVRGCPAYYSTEPTPVCTVDSQKEALLWHLDRMREAVGKPCLTPLDFSCYEV